LQLLILSYFFYPMNTPIGALLTTKLQMKVLYINSFIMVIIQYAGLWILYNLGDTSLILASLKILCVGVSCLLLLNWAIKYLQISASSFFTKILLLPILVSLVFALIGINII